MIIELLSLTGVTANRLHGWLLKQPAFQSGLASRARFSRTWHNQVPKSLQEGTGDCNLGTRPITCHLRFRALRFNTPAGSGKGAAGEKYFLLAAYERCTSFLHVRLYADDSRSDDYPAGLTVEAFHDFCADIACRVGLPLPQILLTNRFLLAADGTLMTARTARQALRDALDDGGEPKLIVEVNECAAVSYPAASFARALPYAALQAELRHFVNAHNEEFALRLLERGRAALRAMAGQDEGLFSASGKSAMRLRQYNVVNAVPLARLRITSEQQNTEFKTDDRGSAT